MLYNLPRYFPHTILKINRRLMISSSQTKILLSLDELRISLNIINSLQAMILIIVTFLAAAAASQECPSSVKNELQLISLPIKCFHELYDSSTHDGHRISRVINQRLEVYKRMLQEIKMQDWEHLKTTPVLKWAQSEGQIFVSFKLSHRQDSPTCSDIRSESFETSQVNVTDGDIPYEIHNGSEDNFSTFRYKGECLFTSEKLLFTLNLQFESFLSKATLRKEGLGLYTLVGDKSEKKIWGKPFNDFRKAAIWPELRHKYSGDMDKYFEMMEDSESSNKKRRRRRPKGEEKNEEKVEQKNNEL